MRKIFIAAMAVLLVSVVAFAQSGSVDINNIKLTLKNLPWIVAIDGLEKSAGTIQGFLTDSTVRSIFTEMGICRANVPVKVRVKLPYFTKLEEHGTGVTDVITGEYYFRAYSNINSLGSSYSITGVGYVPMNNSTYTLGVLKTPHNGIVYGSLWLRKLTTGYPSSVSTTASNLQSDDRGIYTTNLTVTYIAQP